MSGPESDQQQERRLEDFLAGRDAIHRVYREAATESSPPELDLKLLREAREAVAAVPTVAPRSAFRGQRWRYSLAAVLVLSFSTLLVMQQDPAVQREVMMQAPSLPPPAPVIPESMDAPPPPAAAAVEEDAASVGAAPRLQKQAAPSAAPARDAGAAAQRRRESAPLEAELLRDRDAPAAAAAPAAPAAAAEASEDRQAREDLEAKSERGSATGAAMPAAEPPEAERWLQRIRELLADGRRAEARRELADYRRRYPQLPLPPDLADFAAQAD
jgi:hypothetical protein